MDPRRQFGNSAEELAARFLIAQGARLVAKQFQTRIGEIDLIFEDKGELLFVEVKARHGHAFGYPEESVTREKLRKMHATAELYLKKERMEHRPYRFEVIAIEYGSGEPSILRIPVVDL